MEEIEDHFQIEKKGENLIYIVIEDTSLIGTTSFIIQLYLQTEGNGNDVANVVKKKIGEQYELPSK